VQDYLTFRRMIAPVVIQTLFWLLIVALLVSGIAGVVQGAHRNRAGEVLAGFLFILLGPFVARLYCEVLIVVFRINDSLTEMRKLAVWAAERSYALDGGGDDEDDGTTTLVPADA
jgi:Domain of unknown function (DUF4282)